MLVTIQHVFLFCLGIILFPKKNNDKFVTSFIFKVKSIPAALYKALGGFATNGININKIESYLLDGKFVSAQFYVEAECHPDSRAFRNAFEELRFFSEADSVKILGTYKKNYNSGKIRDF